MTRASTTIGIGAAALALALGYGCGLSMVGKDQCNGAADCLDGYRCFKSQCVPESECRVACGDTCCEVTETCNPLTKQCRPVCVPQCKGRQCGNDQCGGSCGDCGKGWNCNPASFLCETCQPNCAGKQCGSDGCGRQCGTCGSSEMCNAAFQCVSAPRDAGGGWADAGVGPGPDGGVVHRTDAGGEPLDAEAEAPDAGTEPSDAGSEADADEVVADDAAVLPEADAAAAVEWDAASEGLDAAL
ncbi:MAG TPA: hypothetical protein VGK67_31615 [Myxococcales bacterium]|jgi:hypothetical protein